MRRVIRDNGLDSVGFEVELVNRTGKDFAYDPESFGVRIGDEVYPQAISDAGGLVSPGKTQTAFFVVAGTATGGRNDLAVTNKFDVVMRQVTGARAPNRKLSAEWEVPPDKIPTAQSGSLEPPLPTVENNSAPSQLGVISEEKQRKPHRHRVKTSRNLEANRSAQFPVRDQKSQTVAQKDE